MIARTAQTSPLSIARLAGFLYLLTVPFGVFTLMYVPSSLIVSGDAATTASNIMASESLFRPSLVSALLGQIIGILYVLILYKLLKPVNKIWFFLGNYWPKRTYYKLSPKKII
jgi:hypothetical protein